MKKILIVDDAVFMHKMLAQICTANGYEICGEAENGAQAVEKYKEVELYLLKYIQMLPYCRYIRTTDLLILTGCALGIIIIITGTSLIYDLIKSQNALLAAISLCPAAVILLSITVITITLQSLGTKTITQTVNDTKNSGSKHTYILSDNSMMTTSDVLEINDCIVTYYNMHGEKLGQTVIRN